jgi:hypothetical protein
MRDAHRLEYHRPKTESLAMKLPRVRFTVRRMMAAVAVIATLLCGHRALEQRSRYVRNHSQVRVWAGQRDKYKGLAELARSKGDLVGAAEFDKLAMHAEGLRRVFEHLAAGGNWNGGPPIPKDPW